MLENLLYVPQKYESALSPAKKDTQLEARSYINYVSYH